MNVQIVFEAVRFGLICDISTQKTEQEITEWSAAGRKPVYGQCAWKAVRPKGENFGKAANCTKEELADVSLWHAVRYAANRVRGGDATSRDLRISHVHQNIIAWCKNRDVDYSHCVPILQAGWWRRAVSSRPIAEMAALIRCLDRAVKSGGSDESPFADADNGALAYDASY